MVEMKLESGPGSVCVHIQHLFCSATLALWTPVVSVGIKVRTPRAVALSVALEPFEDVTFLARELLPGKMHIFPIFCIKFHGVNGLLKLLCSFQVRNSCKTEENRNRKVSVAHRGHLGLFIFKLISAGA